MKYVSATGSIPFPYMLHPSGRDGVSLKFQEGLECPWLRIAQVQELEVFLMHSIVLILLRLSDSLVLSRLVTGIPIVGLVIG